MRYAATLSLIALTSLLSGCNWVTLNASGDIARQQGDLIVVSTVLMLLIVVPVMALTGWFAWHYRASNQRATYTPDWHHSTQLELVIWSAPPIAVALSIDQTRSMSDARTGLAAAPTATLAGVALRT